MTTLASVASDSTATKALRQSTARTHRAMEANIDLLSDDLRSERYVELLVAFASVHLALDEQLGAALEAHLGETHITTLDFASRRKVPNLRADLLGFGRELPSVVPVPATASLGRCLGALYVCEGATLGGSVIAPHVRRVLGADTPVAHFTSYGPRVPAMWATCRRVLNEVLVSADLLEEAIDAAEDVFRRFGEVLAR